MRLGVFALAVAGLVAWLVVIGTMVWREANPVLLPRPLFLVTRLIVEARYEPSPPRLQVKRIYFWRGPELPIAEPWYIEDAPARLDSLTPGDYFIALDWSDGRQCGLPIEPPMELADDDPFLPFFPVTPASIDQLDKLIQHRQATEPGP